MNMDILRFRICYKALIILLSFVVYGCTTTDNPSADSSSENGETTLSTLSYSEAFNSALQLEQQGDFNKALYYYIEALQHEPENANVLVRIADIHVQLGNDEIATRAYLQAVEFDPTLTLAYQGLGSIEMANRNYAQSKIYLQRAILLDQKRLSDKGAIKQKSYYALDNKSPIESYMTSGIIEDMQRRFSSARTYYQLALNQNPNSANVLSNLGYSYYLTGDLTLAESYYKRAINADPKLTRAWTNLGLVYVRKNQYTRAIKTFKQVMTEYEAYNDLGYFVMLDGRLDEAEYFFQKAIDLSPRYFTKAYSNLELVKMKQQDLLQKQGAYNTAPLRSKKNYNPVAINKSRTIVLPYQDNSEQKLATTEPVNMSEPPLNNYETTVATEGSVVAFGPQAEDMDPIEEVEVSGLSTQQTEIAAVESVKVNEPVVEEVEVSSLPAQQTETGAVETAKVNEPVVEEVEVSSLSTQQTEIAAVETAKVKQPVVEEVEISSLSAQQPETTAVETAKITEPVVEEVEVSSLSAQQTEIAAQETVEVKQPAIEETEQISFSDSSEDFQVVEKANPTPSDPILDTSIESLEVNSQPPL
ncbi:MAG: tetratricopeptide repeat protein [Psychromonas sp.]